MAKSTTRLVSIISTLGRRFARCQTAGTTPGGASALACSMAAQSESRSVRLHSTCRLTPCRTMSGLSGPPWNWHPRRPATPRSAPSSAAASLSPTLPLVLDFEPMPLFSHRSGLPSLAGKRRTAFRVNKLTAKQSSNERSATRVAAAELPQRGRCLPPAASPSLDLGDRRKRLRQPSRLSQAGDCLRGRLRRPPSPFVSPIRVPRLTERAPCRAVFALIANRRRGRRRRRRIRHGHGSIVRAYAFAYAFAFRIV